MKKQIVTGLIGAAALLAMAATGALGACEVTAVKPGYTGDATAWTNGCIAGITVTCSDDAGATTPPKTYCVHSALYADGVMASALTAMVEGYTVDPSIYSGAGYMDGLILSLTVTK
ncbi:hypothetical protein GCAAIG_10830 [Candidatus Electronema halotolerans]